MAELGMVRPFCREYYGLVTGQTVCQSGMSARSKLSPSHDRSWQTSWSERFRVDVVHRFGGRSGGVALLVVVDAAEAAGNESAGVLNM
jgi:hypothetical protein